MSPTKKKEGFSAEEKAAMRARAKELKAGSSGRPPRSSRPSPEFRTIVVATCVRSRAGRGTGEARLQRFPGDMTSPDPRGSDAQRIAEGNEEGAGGGQGRFSVANMRKPVGRGGVRVLGAAVSLL